MASSLVRVMLDWSVEVECPGGEKEGEIQLQILEGQDMSTHRSMTRRPPAVPVLHKQVASADLPSVRSCRLLQRSAQKLRTGKTLNLLFRESNRGFPGRLLRLGVEEVGDLARVGHAHFPAFGGLSVDR